MFQTVKLASLLAAAALVLAACASPANRAAMTPTGLNVVKQHPFSLQVKTAGGSQTGVGDSSNISDDDLKAAIEAAVVENRVFKTVVKDASGGDYELTVAIVTMDKPKFGATFTVNMEASWSLAKVADRSVAMRKLVKSSGTATVGDAFVGAERLRLAVERAANSNISQGLQAVAGLAL